MVLRRGPWAVERRPFIALPVVAVIQYKVAVPILIFLRRSLSSCMPAKGKRPANPARQVSHYNLDCCRVSYASDRYSPRDAKQGIAKSLPRESHKVQETKLAEGRKRHSRENTFLYL